MDLGPLFPKSRFTLLSGPQKRSKPTLQMQQKQVRSLGLVLNVNVPASYEEFDALAKRPLAALEEATANVLYRSWMADFREKFCEALEVETGIARAFESKELKSKNEDGSPKTTEVWSENEGEYVNRVLATKKVEIATFQALADKIAAEITFDPAQPERKATTPKLAKTYRETAQKILAAGADAAQRAATKLSGLLGRPVQPTEESLAIAIKEDQARQAKLLAESLMS